MVRFLRVDAENRHALTPQEFAAIAYLAAPVAIFILAYMRPQTWVGAIFVIFCLWRNAALVQWTIVRPNWRLASYFAAVATLVVFASGTFGLVYANSDWIKHFAVFHFLLDNSSLVGDAPGYDGGTLRYYLGWYVIPALVAKTVSPSLLPFFIGGWSILGVWLFFANAAGLTDNSAWKYAFPVVFLLFSGADLIGTAITHFHLGPIYHIEWWAGWIEYSSNYTDIIWAPQHTIPAWIGAVLVLRFAKNPSSLISIPVLLTAIILWSPFAAIGLTPFFLYVLWTNRQSLAIEPFISAFLMLAVILLMRVYLTASTDGMMMKPVWDTPCLGQGSCYTPKAYILFVLIEVVPTIAICLFATRARDAFVWIASFLLLTLPFIHFGTFNDINLHGSIPSIALISLTAWRAMPSASAWLRASFALVMLAGVATPIQEIRRSLVLANIPYQNVKFDDAFPKADPLRSQYVIVKTPWAVRKP